MYALVAAGNLVCRRAVRDLGSAGSWEEVCEVLLGAGFLPSFPVQPCSEQVCVINGAGGPSEFVPPPPPGMPPCESVAAAASSIGQGDIPLVEAVPPPPPGVPPWKLAARVASGTGQDDFQLVAAVPAPPPPDAPPLVVENTLGESDFLLLEMPRDCTEFVPPPPPGRPPWIALGGDARGQLIASPLGASSVQALSATSDHFPPQLGSPPAALVCGGADVRNSNLLSTVAQQTLTAWA